MLECILNKKNVIVFTCLLGSALTSSYGLAETAGVENQASLVQDVVQNQVAVNINVASAEEIAAALKGIGQKKAEAIVVFRELNGTFLSLEEIAQVKGIGPAILEKNKAAIRL